MNSHRYKIIFKDEEEYSNVILNCSKIHYAITQEDTLTVCTLLLENKLKHLEEFKNTKRNNTYVIPLDLIKWQGIELIINN